MLRLAADENFNGDIVRGLLRRNPKLDIVRVQDVGLSGADDPSVLQWAADQGRIIVTHDISTLVKHALDRVAASQPMPGVFEVSSIGPIGQAIDDLILLVECSVEGEWEDKCTSCPSEKFPNDRTVPTSHPQERARRSGVLAPIARGRGEEREGWSIARKAEYKPCSSYTPT